MGATLTVNAPVYPQPTIDPQSVVIVGGRLSFSVNGDVGPNYTIWTLTNLLDRELLFLTNAPTPPFEFTDPNPAIDSARFYRIQLGP